MAHRQLKKQVLELLRSTAWTEALETLAAMPARQVVNPLFGLLYHGEPLVRWRAVSAMGIVVSGLADQQMESARIIMRRFMWNLNDESGGIGWGSPESMGEIMVRHAGLAREYASILVSYADPEGNFLEHPGLQQGVLWALGRLGRARPAVARRAAGFVLPFLQQSEDPILRGLAVWAVRPAVDDALRPMLEPLREDRRTLHIYIDDELVPHTIADLAAQALDSVHPEMRYFR
jgi:HEAT repeat protein